MSDEVQPCLFAAYDKTVRNMMDTVDKLREVGIDKDLHLPQIVVIGDQSSGKSSTLEALSGVQLPRGTDIVTRCPLVMSLRSGFKSRELVYSCKIKYNNKTIEIDELDVDEIGEKISAAQNELAGTDKAISNKPIHLEIIGDNLPDLTLVDLPGIARVPMKGQPRDIAHQTKELIKTYITNPEAIILVMAACDSDIATNEALNMAKEIDPNGVRTLGVLTKADRIEAGHEAKILKLMRNVTGKKDGVNLPKGYTLIKCRNVQQLKKSTSLEEAARDEETFFKQNPMFSSDNSLKNKLGTKTLARKLTTELQIHLKKAVPTLKVKVSSLLRSAEKELVSLGPGIPTDTEGKRERLVSILRAYEKTVTRVFDGDQVNPATKVNLWRQARDEFTKFSDTIKTVKTAPLGEIMEVIRNQRGSEPGNFMRSSCSKSFILDMLAQCQQPAMDCMEAVFTHADNVLNDLADHHCNAFPLLIQAIRGELEALGREEYKGARVAMETLFKMEEVVFAFDGRYYEEWSKLPFQVKPNVVDYHDPQYQARDMQRSIVAHYKVATQRLVDTVPMVILYHYFKLLPERIGEKMNAMSINPTTLRYLDEEDEMQEKRLAIKSRVERLEKASQCLTKY